MLFDFFVCAWLISRTMSGTQTPSLLFILYTLSSQVRDSNALPRKRHMAADELSLARAVFKHP